MKKYSIGILIVLVALSLISCSKNEESNSTEKFPETKIENKESTKVDILAGAEGAKDTKENLVTKIIRETIEELPENVDEKSNIEIATITDEKSTLEIYSDENPFYYKYMELAGTANLGSFYLELVDREGNAVWKRQWDNLEYTELNLGGIPYKFEDKIFIGVYGDLYAMDFTTGKILWVAKGTGSTVKPIVHDNVVYMAGYYGPMLCALNINTGEILWSVEGEEQFSWPLKMVSNENEIYVMCSEYKGDTHMSVVCKYDSEGTYLGYDYYTGDLWAAHYWESTNASSVLNSNEGRYSSDNIIDLKFETAWVEGTNGYGINDWVEILNPWENTVEYISIANGYQKSFETYEENGKLKKFKIDFSDGQYFIVNTKFAFELNSEEHIQLVEPIETNKIRLTILDVIEGTKYEDTCISEIRTQ